MIARLASTSASSVLRSKEVVVVVAMIDRKPRSAVRTLQDLLETCVGAVPGRGVAGVEAFHFKAVPDDGADLRQVLHVTRCHRLREHVPRGKIGRASCRE